jgi:cytochrome P450
MRVGLWARWVAMHGVPRAFFAVQARRGNPFARLLANQGRGDDRYALIEQIRARGPVVRTPFVWVSVDHGVCREILRDKRFGVTAPADMDLPRPLRRLISMTDPGVANPVEPPAMVIVNPPDHTRYRQLVAHSFTPRAIDTLSTRVSEVTRELIERISATPHPDLIADFAAQLPVAIIAEILDLAADTDTHSRMLEWGHAGSPLLDIGIAWKTYRRAIDAMRGIDRYLTEHFHELRAGEPGDNPFSRLAADGTLTDRELTANAALIVGAGFETTVNLIGNGIVVLLQHPEQLARLRDEPHLWPAAVEEILRIDSPVQMTARTPDCDVEIAGHHIAAGEMVALLLGGANRDPNVFTDPSSFDITRTNAREHLAFATGVHACLGAALARIEGAIALRTLFETFPDLRLTAPPQRRGLVNLHGFTRLPAQLGSRRATAAELGAY